MIFRKKKSWLDRLYRPTANPDTIDTPLGCTGSHITARSRYRPTGWSVPSVHGRYLLPMEPALWGYVIPICCNIVF
jgi:hypothetical protein